MKATLEFKLPEEAMEFKDAQEGTSWKIVVEDLFAFLRNETKHKDHSAEEYATYDQVRDFLARQLEERGLSLY